MNFYPFLRVPAHNERGRQADQTNVDGNREQLVPKPVAKGWKSRRQHAPIHHNVYPNAVNDAGYKRLFRQERYLATRQVKDGYHHERNEEMKRQTKGGACQSALVRFRAEQSSGDSLQSSLKSYAALPPNHKRR